MSPHNQPVRWEKVYVFISSTFGDMHAERDYLVKRVFPALQDWCERRRLRLVDIDLRWGVTEADTTSKRAVEVCLERINDCRPFFLCFLGQRHGWMPKAEDVADSTFKKFPALLEALQANASVTELEIRHAILQPFTSTDPDAKHAEPQPAEHAFFYFRDAGYLNDLRDTPRQLLCTFTDEVGPDDETDDERQQRERARDALQTLREATIPQDKPVIYQAGWHTELTTPELTMPLECTDEWRRKWNRFAHLDLAATDERIPEDKLAAANEYNAALTRGRLSQFRSLASARGQFDPNTELAQIIQHDLQEAIQTRFPTHTEVGQEDELQKEIDQQEGFLLACSEGFIDRTGDFDQLNGYVADESNKLCVLTAPGGMGKSTLLAKWIDSYLTRVKPNPEPSIHFRFIGASDRSTTVYSLLRSLLGEMLAAKTLDLQIPPDPNKLREALPELLTAIGKSGKTVIVLDALNQLESGLQDLHWLPRTLPENIKLIVSFKRDDDASEQVYQQFHAAQAILSEVKPFANLDDRRRLVTAYLRQYLKELDEAHIAALIATAGASNPLYLKVVLSELRVFGAFAGLAEKIRRDFGDNPITAFQGVLQRLASDPAYAPIEPRQAVPLLFGLLAHARHGLSVEELTSLFVQALPLEDNEQGRQAAADTINLLLRQVRPFLARREGRYDYFYESFKLAAQQHCAISEEEKSADGWSAPQFHQLLAGLFSRQADPSGNRQWDGHSPRALRDLPYHLLEGKQSVELFRVAREEVFLTAQKRSFPDEPELHLQTIQSAIEGAARIDDAARMAEFVLAHARQVVVAGQESPLDALRSRQLGRAWKLADLYDPERCVLWYLLLTWELRDVGRLEDAQATLKRLQEKDLPRLSGWESECAADLIHQVIVIGENVFAELHTELLDDSGRQVLCERFAASGYFVAALQAARAIAAPISRATALNNIATMQAQAGDRRAARVSFAAAHQAAQRIDDEWDQMDTLVAIATAQAKIGEFAAAVQTAREIDNGDEKIEALIAIVRAQAAKSASVLQTTYTIGKEAYRTNVMVAIAAAQAQAGEITAALETAEGIGDKECRVEALVEIALAHGSEFAAALQTAHEIEGSYKRAEALRAIAVAQAQTGEFYAALETVQAIEMVDGLNETLVTIAATQAQEGEFAAAFQTAQWINNKVYRADALIAVAIAQVHVGEREAALASFTTALQTAQEIDDKWDQEEVLVAIAAAEAQAGEFAVALQTAQGIGSESIRAAIIGAQAQAGEFTASLQTARPIDNGLDQVKALVAIAVAEAQVGKRDAAHESFAAAIRTAQGIGGDEYCIAAAMRNVAMAQMQVGEKKTARESFATALRTARGAGTENRSSALVNIATVQARARDLVAALKTAEGIDDKEHQAKALAAIAAAQAQIGEYAAALQIAQGITDTECHSDALIAIAVAQAQTSNFAAAFQTTLELSEEEDRAYVLVEIAKARAHVGEFAAALQTALTMDENNRKADVLVAIAVAQAQAGEFAAALHTTQEISDKVCQAKALGAVVAAQVQAGEHKAAGESLTLAIQSAQMSMIPYSFAEGLREIAAALAQAGESETAKAIFIAAIQNAKAVDRGYQWGALGAIAVTQAEVREFGDALQTAQSIDDKDTREEVLVKIAAAQAQSGQFSEAFVTTQQIEDQRPRSSALGYIAAAQASGFGEQVGRTATLILTDRDSRLPEIAEALAKAGDRKNFKGLLISCAYYPKAAYRMCGLLARVYPEQATAVAAVVTNTV